MNNVIFPEDVANVVKSFYSVNAGDEATEALIISIGAELLDISHDKMLEMIGQSAVTKIPDNPRMSKIKKVKWLRDNTGADLKTCVDAIDYGNGDLIRAKSYIDHGW